jgi:hypothetical protein
MFIVFQIRRIIMAALRHFKADEVVVDQEQAFRLLKFFWIEPGIIPGSLTVDDRAFAQALLLEDLLRKLPPNIGFGMPLERILKTQKFTRTCE